MSWMLLEALKKLQAGELEIPNHREPTKHEKRKIRRSIETLSQLLPQLIIGEEDIERLFGPADEGENWHLEHFPKFGVRAWLFRGKWCDVVLWDEGNHWYTVLAILPRSQSIYEWLKEVY